MTPSQGTLLFMEWCTTVYTAAQWVKSLKSYDEGRQTEHKHTNSQIQLLPDIDSVACQFVWCHKTINCPRHRPQHTNSATITQQCNAPSCSTSSEPCHNGLQALPQLTITVSNFSNSIYAKPIMSKLVTH